MSETGRTRTQTAGYSPEDLAAARNGDQDAFQRLTDPYRRELLVHGYRILGSLEDAEDILQETLLRAWRRLSTFEGRSSPRAWLYKIATNAALDMVDSRPRRHFPTGAQGPADPRDPLPGPASEILWLEPLPDALIDDSPNANPEQRYVARESVKLAFLSALQFLPGRQRAALILRDVLGWNAAEVADLLEVSAAAANSALQRARATLESRRTEMLGISARPTDAAHLQVILERYVTAWEASDTRPLVELLHEQAILTMPPLPAWFRGRVHIQQFLATNLFAGQPAGLFRLRPTRANGCPAFASYRRDDAGIYRPAALHVLTIADEQIVEIDDFLALDDHLFARFGLPALG